MILSTQTDLTAAMFGPEKTVELIAQAGFDAIDLSMFEGESTAWIYSDGFERRSKALVKLAEENGVYFNQAHAPFPSYRVGNEEYNEKIRPMLIRSIEVAGLIGAKNIVVHPVFFPENKKENNLKMYNELLPTAKKAGVKIALENMWGRDPRMRTIVANVCSTAQELSEYVDALDPDWFTVCLDIGHIGLIREYEAPFIRALGAERLTCVHIHDNNYLEDQHISPFLGKLPWDEITKAFAEIGYKGDLTLESDNFLKYMPASMYPAGLKFMEAAGRELIRMIEEAEI